MLIIEMFFSNAIFPHNGWRAVMRHIRHAQDNGKDLIQASYIATTTFELCPSVLHDYLERYFFYVMCMCESVIKHYRSSSSFFLVHLIFTKLWALN